VCWTFTQRIVKLLQAFTQPKHQSAMPKDVITAAQWGTGKDCETPEAYAVINEPAFVPLAVERGQGFLDYSDPSHPEGTEVWKAGDPKCFISNMLSPDNKKYYSETAGTFERGMVAFKDRRGGNCVGKPATCLEEYNSATTLVGESHGDEQMKHDGDGEVQQAEGTTGDTTTDLADVVLQELETKPRVN
jgi:hypothetical protein